MSSHPVGAANSATRSGVTSCTPLPQPLPGASQLYTCAKAKGRYVVLQLTQPYTVAPGPSLLHICAVIVTGSPLLSLPPPPPQAAAAPAWPTRSLVALVVCTIAAGSCALAAAVVVARRRRLLRERKAASQVGKDDMLWAPPPPPPPPTPPHVRAQRLFMEAQVAETES